MRSEISQKLADAMEDETKQADFYECFLNELVYIPTWNKPEENKNVAANQNEGVQIQPVVMEDNGLQFIMMFDTKERLKAWAKDETYFAAMHGVMVLETFRSHFHLLLNFGEGSNKVFRPEEIEWLLAHVTSAGQA